MIERPASGRNERSVNLTCQHSARKSRIALAQERRIPAGDELRTRQIPHTRAEPGGSSLAVGPPRTNSFRQPGPFANFPERRRIWTPDRAIFPKSKRLHRSDRCRGSAAFRVVSMAYTAAQAFWAIGRSPEHLTLRTRCRLGAPARSNQRRRAQAAIEPQRRHIALRAPGIRCLSRITPHGSLRP